MKKARIIFTLFLTILFVPRVNYAQFNTSDLMIYISAPSDIAFDEEFDYLTSFIAPLSQLKIGLDIYSKDRKRIALRLGALTGNESYVKPMNYVDPELGQIMNKQQAEKRRIFSFVSVGAEFRSGLRNNSRGLYVTVEPQLSFLIFSRETLEVRERNDVVRYEVRNMNDRLNRFNAVLILGGGYELGMGGPLSFQLGFNAEFRPIHGYYKTDNHRWLSPGITAGARYVFGLR